MKSETITKLVTGVTKKWAKQRKAEERAASSEIRRWDALVLNRRTTIKDAAYEVMEAAYMKASSNNTLPAHARQIMYAARPQILKMTGKKNLDSKYFCQDLLPDFIAQHPEIDWDVVFDARGHFEEPHSGVVVPLGTLHVRAYLRKVASTDGDEDIDLSIGGGATIGPRHRFGAILFVEKEGFMPLFKKVNLAEKYDIAIMSTKGLTVTASRKLVDVICGSYEIPLLVLHDFDKAGFSILGTLQRDTRRYKFQNSIRLIDLGLRVQDVQDHGLQSEPVSYGESDPCANLQENGAREADIDFLVENSDYPHFAGKRVELNAFSSGGLIKWIETKLEAHGIKKVIPGKDHLETEYRRAVQMHYLEERMSELVDEARDHSDDVELPGHLKHQVEQAIRKNPELPWDGVVANLARENA